MLRSRSLKDASFYSPIVVDPQPPVPKENTISIPSPSYGTDMLRNSTEDRADETDNIQYIQFVKSTSTASFAQGKQYKHGLPTNPRAGVARTGDV